MGRHKNNAIIVTTIVGERGPQGFPGPDGQACYEGTGDPNTLGLVLPTYSTDYTRTRGTETLYYQDTITGEVWKATMINGVLVPATIAGTPGSPSPVTLQTWELTTINVRGQQGETGATALDKIDVNLMNGNNMASFTVDTSSGAFYATTEICKVNFPGTNVAPDFSEIKIIASLYGIQGVSFVGVYDASDTFLSGVQVSGEAPSVHTITGVTFPTDPEILTFKATAADSNPTQEDIEIKIAYISIR